jgi:hypothetical protein
MKTAKVLAQVAILSSRHQTLVLIAALLALAAAQPQRALAAPETWFDPSASMLGTEMGGRFGASLACSAAVPSISNSSYIAVGAPDENGGVGAVYIYNPNSPNSHQQKLTSDSPAAGKRYGASVAFIEDINLDGIDELVVGEPNDNGANGFVRVYISTNSTPPFSTTPCVYQPGPPGWGQRILEIDRDNSTADSKIMVASQSGDLMTVELVEKPLLSLFCSMVEQNNFSGTSSGERFGFSVAEVATPPFNVYSKLLVGAPLASSSTGRVDLIDRDLAPGSQLTTFRSGLASESIGLCVAGDKSSDLLALAGPGSGKIYISSLSKNSDPDPNICSVTNTIPTIATNNGTSIAHMQTAFGSFLGDSYATFASARDESETGGSVALFAASITNGCSPLKVYNNCILDTAQEQGGAIVGGTRCKAVKDSSAVPALVVGSPGWSGSRGRVDLILEGAQLATARPCVAVPTATPTPSQTPTPIPTLAPPTVEAAVLVSPGTRGLPPPQVTLSDSYGRVTITFPLIKRATGLITVLSRLWKIEERQLRRLFGLPGNFGLQYVAEIRSAGPSKASTMYLQDISKASLVNVLEDTSSTRRRMLATRNRKTSVRLTPGQSYSITYRVQFTLKNPRRTASTATSARARFST